MRFGVLGSLLVHDGDAPIEVRSPLQRAVLATLLVHAGRPVAADTLAETVWDGKPPRAAMTTLRTHVMRLRRVLGPRAAARLVTQFPGYRIDAGDDEVDLLQFTRLCREGGAAIRSASWADARALLDEALALWRGQPLADVPAEALHRDERPQLEHLHVQAQEWRIEAELRLGGGSELVPALQSLIAEHPLYERFHGQLMLALYRGGRQAEALGTYDRVRARLVEEIGAEPGHHLRELHQRILAADAELAGPALAGPASPGRAQPDDLPAADAWASSPVTPRELPASAWPFVGRGLELTALTALLESGDGAAPGSVTIAAICGTAGVGKTALAVHWAHRHAGRFPDGQLYVDLRGFGSGRVLPAADALAGFLRALGGSDRDLPESIAERARRYRTLLAGRRMLIVLDNARDETQVRPLLPADPGCMVLVTSRCQLAGLAARDGAHLISLDLLAEEEARELLTARLGTALAAEPQVVTDLIALCGRLPLALGLAAARAAGRPAFALAQLRSQLTDVRDRLDSLDAGDGEADLRTAFSWSLRRLSERAVLVFRLLGLHPGTDIGIAAARSLAYLDEHACRAALAELARVHLLTERAPGRFASHELLRAYAAELAGRMPAAQRQAATGRMLDHYLQTAALAASSMERVCPIGQVSRVSAGAVRAQIGGRDEALAWFEAERAALSGVIRQAARAGYPDHAWQLPMALREFYVRRGYWGDLLPAQEIALAAARQAGNTEREAEAHRCLGASMSRLGRLDEARTQLGQALRLAQDLDDAESQGQSHFQLALVCGGENDYRRAIAHCGLASRLARACRHAEDEAYALNATGLFHARLGDLGLARAHSERALRLHRRAGGAIGESLALQLLGCLEFADGRYRRATGLLRQAHDLCRETGDRYFSADMLDDLGSAYHADGKLDEAKEAWRQALTTFNDLGLPSSHRNRPRLCVQWGGAAPTGQRMG
jgi:DNA-binding SARP family transcriptional activator/tetratricopeptide (TPR) repeat protein